MGVPRPSWPDSLEFTDEPQRAPPGDLHAAPTVGRGWSSPPPPAYPSAPLPGPARHYDEDQTQTQARHDGPILGGAITATSHQPTADSSQEESAVSAQEVADIAAAVADAAEFGEERTELLNLPSPDELERAVAEANVGSFAGGGDVLDFPVPSEPRLPTLPPLPAIPTPDDDSDLRRGSLVPLKAAGQRPATPPTDFAPPTIENTPRRPANSCPPGIEIVRGDAVTVDAPKGAIRIKPAIERRRVPSTVGKIELVAEPVTIADGADSAATIVQEPDGSLAGSMQAPAQYKPALFAAAIATGVAISGGLLYIFGG